MKLGFISLGCAKNLVDSEYILGLLENEKISFESNPKHCDVIVINTCGFILSAKKEAIDTILEMAEYKTKGRLKKLIVTGCLAERYYDDLKKEMPEIDCLVRISSYNELPKILREELDIEVNSEYGQKRKLINHGSHAYLKIAEGCNNRCAFCAIPLIRHDLRSFEMDKLIKEAEMLSGMGIKELDVIAQDTTSYGLDFDGHSHLKELLVALNKLPFKWIRLLYMYPDEIDDDLLKTMASLDKVVPYFDIPTQYGNDSLLKLMNRRGSVKLIEERIATIRAMFKDAFIRTTLIIGFPHESDETFKDTLKYVDRNRFDALGAFTYSKEEGTKGYEMDKQVPEDVALLRLDLLMNKQKAILKSLNQRYIDKIFDVVIDSYDGEYYHARTWFMAPDGVDSEVLITSAQSLKIGEFYKCRLTKVQDYDFLGEIVD